VYCFYLFQILALLLALPEASSVFLSLQSEFIAAACSDDFVAGTNTSLLVFLSFADVISTFFPTFFL